MSFIHDPWLLNQFIDIISNQDKKIIKKAQTPPVNNQKTVADSLRAILNALKDQLKPSPEGPQQVGAMGVADLSSKNMDSLGDFVQWLSNHGTRFGGQVIAASSNNERPSEDHGFYKIESGTVIEVPLARQDRSKIGFWINADLLKEFLVSLQSDAKLKSNVIFQVQLLKLVQEVNRELDTNINENYRAPVQQLPDDTILDNLPKVLNSGHALAQGNDVKLTYGDLKTPEDYHAWLNSSSISIQTKDGVANIRDESFDQCVVLNILAVRAQRFASLSVAKNKAAMSIYVQSIQNIAREVGCNLNANLTQSPSGSTAPTGSAAPGTVEYLKRLVTVLPFDANVIDFNKIKTFSDMYASWMGVQKPSIALLHDRIDKAIQNSNALLSQGLQNTPLNIGGVSNDAFRRYAADPYFAKKLALALSDVITSAAGMYQDFVNVFTQSYGAEAAETLRQQVYPGGPASNNTNILNRLISSL